MTIIRLINGDIGKEKGVSTAIVNAANKQLLIGSGIAGALGRACGGRLQEECKEFIRDLKKELKMNTVPVGAAAITSAYNMQPSRVIIHTVAPQCCGNGTRTADEALQLKSAYVSVLQAAEDKGYDVLAIPFLGAGIFKYPAEESVELALACVLQRCPSQAIKEARFVCNDNRLVAHMSNLIGGCDVSINTAAERKAIIDRIPRSTLAISGPASNHAEITHCLQFAFDSNRTLTRQTRLLSVAPNLASAQPAISRPAQPAAAPRVQPRIRQQQSVASNGQTRSAADIEERRERERVRKAAYRSRQSQETRDEINMRRREKRSDSKVDKRDETAHCLNALVCLRRLATTNNSIATQLERYKRVRNYRWISLKKQLDIARRESKLRSNSKAIWRQRVQRIMMSMRQCLAKLKRSDCFTFLIQDMTVFLKSTVVLPNVTALERLICAQNTADVAREVVRVTTDEIGTIIKGMRRQVTEGVAHPAAVSYQNKNIRTVGRMRYHNCGTADEDSVPLSSIYPSLFAEFMGLPIPPESNEVLPAIEEGLNEVAEGNEIENIVDDNDENNEAAAPVQEVPQENLELLNRAGMEIMNEDPLMREFGGNLAPTMISRVIRAKKCDEECVDMTSSEAEIIQQETMKLGTFTVDDLVKQGFAAFSRKVLPVIEKLRGCYSGIRSFGTRTRELKICITTLEHCQKFLNGRTIQLWGKLLSKDWLWLPQRVRKTIEPLFSTHEDLKHSEAETIRKHGGAIDVFQTKIGELEIELCDLCARFSTSRRLGKGTRLDLTSELRTAITMETARICDKCLMEAYKRRRKSDADQEKPLKFSVRNDVKFDDVPECLAKLNWVEKAMIQRNRPIRAVGCLKNTAGNPTSMRATGGAMVILPVPTEGTIDHVVETLPSDANLSIVVHSARIGSTVLVCLPRVLEALEYLKANNPHYANITINPDFHFNPNTIIIVGDEENREVSQSELDGFMTDDVNHNSLLTHIGTREEVVRANNPAGRSTTCFEEYTLSKNPAQPISNREKFIDERAFPWHFSNGRFGYNAVRRTRLTPRMFVRWVLATNDRRIAVDPNALAFYHGIFEQLDIRNALGMQARMSRTELEAETFEAAEQAAAIDFQMKLQAVSKQLRGTMKYWEAIGNQARGHIAILGTPTWFTTLNPAEKHWDHVISMYQKIYGAEDVNSENIFEWICHDPFFFARYFCQRVRSFFKEIMLREGGPLGTIIHYFYRLEYQSRGTPHVHCLLWSKGAPKDDATEDEKLNYLTEFVTARLPNKDKEPELYAAVETFQRHWDTHSGTCLRTYKLNGKTVKKCRFGFPRPVTPIPIVNQHANELAGVPGAAGKTYFLARTKAEEFINDYSPAMLLAWNGNVDTQYVFGGYQQAISYITGYASKAEKPKEGSEVQKALKGATNNNQGMKALLSLTKMRECGKLEMVDTLLGHQLYAFDSDHVTVNTNHSDTRVRMLKGANQRHLGPKKYLENIFDDYYPRRPNSLDRLSLVTMQMYFRVESANRKPQNEEEEEIDENDENEEEGNDIVQNENIFSNLYHPQSQYSPFYSVPGIPTGTRLRIQDTELKKVFVKVGKPMVPSFFWPNLERCNEESREDYFRRLCMAFIPWRDEAALKTEIATGTVFELYEERWLSFIAKLEQSDNAEKLEAVEDIRLVIKHHEALIEQDRLVRERRREIHQAELAERAGADEEVEGAIEVQARAVDGDRHLEHLESMNEEQKSLFDNVMATIASQHEYEQKLLAISNDSDLSPSEKAAARRALGERPAQLLSLVLGNAGCGKSFVINTIADALTLLYTTPANRAHQPAIVLAAPTGLAAVQISGATLHSLLKIEVQHGRDSAIKPMSEKNLNATRIQFRNVKLLIVDELSMVSNIVLAKMHFRLQEIKGNETEVFGGVNIMLLGDLMQLPPVQAPPMFKPLDAGQLNRIFNSVLSSLNLFSFFSFTELVKNMRQRGDTSFAEMLQRMRVQQMNEDDYKMLESRIIPDIDKAEDALVFVAQYYINVQREDATVLALFGTNAEVACFNEAVIRELALEVTVVECEDTPVENRRSTRTGKSDADVVERIYQRAEYDLSKKPRQPGSAAERKAKKYGYKNGKFDANKAAGLADRVVLAEGGRIMLRRNIDAPKGLVNGVTGVLRKIHKTSSGIPVSLEIEFDGTLGTHDIQKVSAIFNVTNDLQISRRQFPVVMAFGATVHKCQGLTLSNAILSTANFFSGGQAFVAFSRVKTLDGLHLMDLHRDNIYCCRTSREVYNRLRSSIGLAEYGEMTERAGKTPRRQNNVTPSSQKLTTPSSSRRRSSIDRPDSSAAKRRRSSIADTPVTSRSNNALRLQNTNRDCFTNSAVNLFHCLPSVVAAVIEESATNQDVDPILAALADLFTENTNHVGVLRNAIGMTGNDGGCACEAVDKISDCLPAIAKVQISQEMRVKMMCGCGANPTWFEANAFPSPFYLEIHAFKIPVEMNEGTLEDLFMATLPSLFPVCNCGQESQVHEVELTINGMYMFVFLQRHNFDQANGTRTSRRLGITDKDATRTFKFFDNRVKVVAAIEHLTGAGGYGENDHFLLWKKEAQGWSRISDSTTSSSRMCPPKMGTFNVLVLEKL